MKAMKRMYKQMAALFLLLALLLTGCGKKGPTQPSGTPTQTKEEQALEDLRDAIAADGSICGIAFLGWHESTQSMYGTLRENGVMELFPFIETLPAERLVSAAGGEVYLIIPAEDGMEITIEEAFLGDNYDGTLTFTHLYDSDDAQPLLVQCNESDIFANVAITLTDGEQTLSYSPFMSLMDGKLATAYPPTPSITDLTPYDLLLAGSGEADEVQPWCGNWYGIGYDDYGTQLLMSLSLMRDGAAIYSYGEPYSETVEVFEGSWSEQSGIISLNMWGGLVNAMDEGAKYSFIGSFAWQPMGTSRMLLSHESGNTFLYGTDGYQFCFVDFYPGDLAGSWSVADLAQNGHEVAVDLYLSWDGVSSYSITDDIAGSRLVYSGEWGIDEYAEMLWLELYEEGGSDTFTAYYQYTVEGDMLTLYYSSGDCLSYYMQQHGTETLFLNY